MDDMGAPAAADIKHFLCKQVREISQDRNYAMVMSPHVADYGPQTL